MLTFKLISEAKAEMTGKRNPKNNGPNSRKPSLTDEQRAAIVEEMRVPSSSCIAVARRYGVTRNTVYVLARRAGLPRKKFMPRAQAERFLSPYVRRINEHHCVICETEIRRVKKTIPIFCETCKNSIETIRRVKHYIRSWQNTGNDHYRSMAVYMIRKHGLKPVDLLIC